MQMLDANLEQLNKNIIMFIIYHQSDVINDE